MEVNAPTRFVPIGEETAFLSSLPLLPVNAIDTTSAAGRFMLVVLAGAAEMERNLTRERTRSAMAVKKANGKRVGAVPYGYDLADDRITLILNDTEQAVLVQIREWRARGFTLRMIADTLTERNVSTKTGKSSRWTHSAVARILNRDTGRRQSEDAECVGGVARLTWCAWHRSLPGYSER